MARRTKAYYVCKCCANKGQQADFHHWQRARQQEICKLHSVLRIESIIRLARVYVVKE